jgi:hypothetical protein
MALEENCSPVDRIAMLLNEFSVRRARIFQTLMIIVFENPTESVLFIYRSFLFTCHDRCGDACSNFDHGEYAIFPTDPFFPDQHDYLCPIQV